MHTCRSSGLHILHVLCALSVLGLVFSGDCRKEGFKDIIGNTCTRFTYLSYLDNEQINSECIESLTPNDLLSFEDWKFSEKNLLLDSFPIDSEIKNYVRRVNNILFSKVIPTPFIGTIRLAAFSEDAIVNILDLNPTVVRSKSFLEWVSGNTVLLNSVPLAHRYGGHQFGSWADQLGDGRAHFLGEYNNSHGERWELQLKGSGKTPYSRNGDGRAIIRSSVREFLASEAMHYLGVPTSRAVSLVISEDMVKRDQFYTGNIVEERTAVVLRLAPSWFRFGSFEILTRSGELNLLQELADFVIQVHFNELIGDVRESNRYLALFSTVVEQTAKLIAKWQSFGFAHGVCNTDNFSILSITIDYGPFRFMDEYDPDLVPNTSDDESRYSYKNQPTVGLFNLQKLQTSLLPLMPQSDQNQMNVILAGYMDLYHTFFIVEFRQKLGLVSGRELDANNLIQLLLQIMQKQKADYTMTFRQLGEISLEELKIGVDKRVWAVHKLQKNGKFKGWINLYESTLRKFGISDELRRSVMNKVNPRYVLRNWMLQEVIGDVEHNNFTTIKVLQKVLRNPFQIQEEAEERKYSQEPPSWANNIKVSCSS